MIIFCFSILNTKTESSLILYVFLAGTKWCGVGNIALSYSDLGREREVDKCCREHDHCSDFIKPFRYKYGLFNWSLFTRYVKYQSIN